MTTFTANILDPELLEKISAKLKLTTVSIEEREGVLQMLGDNIIRRIIFEVLSQLSESECKQADSLMQKNDFPALIAFLGNNIPDLLTQAQSIAKKELDDTVLEMQ